MNETWRPSNTLMEGNLKYTNSIVPSGDNFGNYSETWPIINPPNTYLSETVSLLRSSLQNSNYNYSRDRNFTPQFYISGKYTNNITLTPTQIDASNLDISFNSKHLWWDYTYTGTSSTFAGKTLYQSGSGEYPTNYSVYSTAYSHSNTIDDIQLMWCNSKGFTSGNYTTNSTENPYIDYTVFYSQSQDYSSKNTTGINKSLTYTVGNDDYYLGGNVSISGTYKWIMVSDIRSSATSFGRLVVTGTKNGGSSTTLTLGTDYLLYIQEIESYFSPGTTIPLGYTTGRSGWKAVHGTWDQGATVQLNNADEAGCYRRNTNTGATAVHFIKYYSPNANTTVFYRIGLKNGDNCSISNITCTYGTN